LFQDITIEELFMLSKKKEMVLIDVRSPSEFENATIPGSLNIPLFDDAERAEIGTIYKQVSVQAAKERGLEIVSAKLPAFVKSFEQIQGEKAVFCWRGGMRSKTTATVLSLMGIHVYRLAGGFRAYRKWVVDRLESLEFMPYVYVINGNTGTGKTVILQRLREEGYPALDLEEMAGHRGSIFGHIGRKANNQKTFDSLLVTELLNLQDRPYILLEGESKRIGKVVLPDFIVNKKEAGTHLFIQMPVEERVRHIIEDYRPWDHKEEVMEAFKRLKNRIHTPAAKEIETALRQNHYEQAVRLLSEYYYDPRYEHAIKQYEKEPIVIKAQNIKEAVDAIKEYLSAVEKGKLQA
jgi:tRNA 2-selenouridine synthase